MISTFKKLIGWLMMVGFICSTEDGMAMGQSSRKPLIIILLGPPGAGKGTHATTLAEHLGLPHISTGDLFREHIQSGSELGLMAKEYIDQGKLVPDALVLDMLFNRIKTADCANGFILDGFPRTLAQAKALDARLNHKSKMVSFNFNVPDSLLIERIAGRIICRDCKKSYHRSFDPPRQAGSCDACGGSLYMRDDDIEGVVRKRLEVYHSGAQQLINYYAAKEKVFCELDGQNSKDEVFHDLLENLSLMVPSVITH